MAVDAPEAITPMDQPLTAQGQTYASAMGNAMGNAQMAGGPMSGPMSGGPMSGPMPGGPMPGGGVPGGPMAGNGGSSGNGATALTRRLQALGVPLEMARRATAPDMYTAIVEALSALPMSAPAPDGPGETLLVIGESAHSVAVARTVADALRLDPSDLLLAGRNVAGTDVDSRRRIAGQHDARGWAKRLRKADVPSIVAVEASLDEAQWAVSIVDAIRPAAVWVVVDASRKTADIARHLRSLRRVDAIAVRATGSSADPASLLALGVPVSLLDGRPPTPHAWAALLCERLIQAGG